MDASQERLRKFALGKSKFFRLPANEEITVKFLGAEVVPNNFDGGQSDCIRYNLEVEGFKQFWDRTSRKLAEQMSEIPEGALISIRKTGEKSKPVYFITSVE